MSDTSIKLDQDYVTNLKYVDLTFNSPEVTYALPDVEILSVTDTSFTGLTPYGEVIDVRMEEEGGGNDVEVIASSKGGRVELKFVMRNAKEHLIPILELARLNCRRLTYH